jgi:hypothetical protein
VEDRGLRTTPPRSLTEARDPMLDAIYAEGDPIIWLRVDLYRTARRAKHVAWSGEGIPHCFCEEGARLTDQGLLSTPPGSLCAPLPRKGL